MAVQLGWKKLRPTTLSASQSGSGVDGPADCRLERDCERGAGAAAVAVVRPVVPDPAVHERPPVVAIATLDEEVERVRCAVRDEPNAHSLPPFLVLASVLFEVVEAV